MTKSLPGRNAPAGSFGLAGSRYLAMGGQHRR